MQLGFIALDLFFLQRTMHTLTFLRTWLTPALSSLFRRRCPGGPWGGTHILIVLRWGTGEGVLEERSLVFSRVLLLDKFAGVGVTLEVECLCATNFVPAPSSAGKPTDLVFFLKQGRENASV